ncbi:hypothetical protein GQ53DRAFT_754555 [Thozetella sp. PMI_491]|nr:hypothetical protein GQ53DRAFT_754555 [Thozetella sp. PMI_491]
MSPSGSQAPQPDERASQAWQQGGMSETVARSNAASLHRRNDESWVEIASQPSSSSLSSIGDEIVTTGLRVGNSSYPRGRRRLHPPQPMPRSYIVSQAAAQAGASSQEEYEETESEEDRVMTSSTENNHPAASLRPQPTAIRSAIESDSEDDDDDENATALGRPSNSPNFRPQPNAFSHPPSHLTHRHSASSAIPSHSPHHRPSFSQRSHTRSHRGPNFMSPSYRADNDAALRASLTTLLSCAAAVGGLPKKDGHPAGPSGVGTGVMPSSQPMELRLVPESELMVGSPTRAAGPLRKPEGERTASNSSAPSGPASASSREREAATAADKGKRAATPQGKSSRATKKKRTSAIVDAESVSYISPTLLTWVVSAGVVVLVSVVGFGAGYVIGREVGRQEGALGVGISSAAGNASAASCGSELVRSTGTGTLKRFRWGAVRSVVA